jgi:CBS-domain-containing membrane protein
LTVWDPGSASRCPTCASRLNASRCAASDADIRAVAAVDVSALPVVDDNGALVDVYARNDITALARDRIYTRLQLQDLTLKEVRAG